MGFAPPLFYGHGIFNYTFGVLPKRNPVHVVVGQPFTVTKTLNPTQEEVQKVHQHYTEVLVQLFNSHKTKYGIPQDKQLDLL
jgi:RNase H-fold protein (predicted Holliday junction resolvase)